MKISLVIPVKNEETSLGSLYKSVCEQTLLPDEVVIVDGGSTDKTVEIARKLSLGQLNLKLVETPQASPGKGRNIGAENSVNDWIAFTDAGIKLEKDWLENLVAKVNQFPDTDIVYGNYSPVTDYFFEKCAAISYVRPLQKDQIRGKFIASCLLKKNVWKSVGGFPDLRAAEDLIFQEEVQKHGFRTEYAPTALVRWSLRSNLWETVKRFALYSKYNVWAQREWDWHYGVLKQYLIVVPFILLALLHSWWWLLLGGGWLFARTAVRIWRHRYEFGLKPLFHPIYFFSIMFIILAVDAATFVGWGQAVVSKK